MLTLRGRFAAIALFFIFIGSLSAQTKFPVPDTKVLSTLQAYLASNNTKAVKCELADTYTDTPKQVGIYFYPIYCRDCYYYVRDSSGRVTRHMIAISFISTKENSWSFDEAKYYFGRQKVVRAATNSPAPPAKPALPQLFEIVDNAMRVAVENAPSAKYDFALKKHNLNEPRFSWLDDDFEKGQYTYDGTLVFHLTPRKDATGKVPQNTKEKDSTAKGSLELIYDTKTASWSANLNMKWAD